MKLHRPTLSDEVSLFTALMKFLMIREIDYISFQLINIYVFLSIEYNRKHLSATGHLQHTKSKLKFNIKSKQMKHDRQIENIKNALTGMPYGYPMFLIYKIEIV